MIASLPMYDWPEMREATDAWWAGLARHLRSEGFREVPERLHRDGPYHGAWSRPDLLLSQTCGYPLTHAFEGRLEVLAIPVYGVDGCNGPNYSSHIVVRDEASVSKLEDLRGRTAAYNTPDSMSGHLALRCVFAPLARNGRFFGRVVRSGSHRKSLAMVREGLADVAAIDCVSYAIAGRYRPELLAGLTVIARGPAVPGLPYVTATGRPAAELARLKRALAAAVAAPGLADVRKALFIDGLEFLTHDAFHRVLELESGCHELGYTRLA